MRRLGRAGKTPKDEDNISQPNSVVKNDVLPGSDRRQSRNILLAAGGAALLILGVNLGVVLWVRDPQARTVFSDVLSPVLDLLASLALFIAAKSSRIRSKRLSIAWGTIALATIFNFLGGVVWFIFEIGLKEPPFPSLADGLYLMNYPIFLVGAFFLAEKPDTAGELMRRVLDMGIIMGAAILGFWNLLIEPIVNSNINQPLLVQAILLAYPVGDLVVLGALLIIRYNPSKKQDPAPIFLLVGSLLALILSDLIYTYQTFWGIYVSGELLDLGWVAGSLLLGLAGVSQWTAVRSNNISEIGGSRKVAREKTKTLQPLMPYVLLAAIFSLLIDREMEIGALPKGFMVFSLGVGVIIILVIIRQIITLSENGQLNSRLQKTMEKIQAQATELEKANRVLRIDISERRQAVAARKQSEDLFRALFELSPDAIVIIDPHESGIAWPILDCNAECCRMNGYTRDEMIGHSIDLLNTAPGTAVDRANYLERVRAAGILRVEIQHRRKDGTLFFADVRTMLLPVGGRELLVGIDHEITERKQAEEDIRRRLEELEAINKVSSALRAAQTLEEMLPILLDETLEMMRATQGSIWLHDPVKDELVAAIARGYEEPDGTAHWPPVKPGKGIVGRVFASGQPYVSGNFRLYPNLSEATRQLIAPGTGGVAIPIRAVNTVIGTFIVNVALPREVTPGEVRLLTTLSEIAGNAIRRTSLRQQTDRRLQQLTALSEIDRAITSSVDLRLNLAMLLKQVIELLGVHAAGVLLFNPASQILEPVATSGFRTRLHELTRQRLGEGYAGRAALERHIIHVPNLAERDDNPLAEKAIQAEGFVSYYAIPLVAKGQIQGVLEIFHRTPFEHDAEWLDFLNTLAGQAAIAIENATLFENLQRSNFELTMAYDATIEGWSRALDLRDKETEGHTQRVMEMTVRLARTFGLGEAELAQVRWGALLHDIGKMGIPDGVLLKPGPLTEEEWAVMKQHPAFAFELLLPIHYLRLALDIPYHHHEKWDGTGYPLGLKGEQIPLTARIFAVVDVWDALRSVRPYRLAWPMEKVVEHIRTLAGTHFDPKVVKAFLELEELERATRS